MAFRRSPPATGESRNIDYFGALAVPPQLEVGKPISAEALVGVARLCRAHMPYALTVQEGDASPVTVFLKKAKRGFVMVEASLDPVDQRLAPFWEVSAHLQKTMKDREKHTVSHLWPATALALARHPWIATCVRLLQAAAAPGTFVFVEVGEDATARMRAWDGDPGFRAETEGYGEPWDDPQLVPFRFVTNDGVHRWAWNGGHTAPEACAKFRSSGAYIAFAPDPKRPARDRPTVISAGEAWYERHTDATSSDSPAPSSDENES
jgi:hypothetical protein